MLRDEVIDEALVWIDGHESSTRHKNSQGLRDGKGFECGKENGKSGQIRRGISFLCSWYGTCYLSTAAGFFARSCLTYF
jgi:hypothetical protein